MAREKFYRWKPNTRFPVRVRFIGEEDGRTLECGIFRGGEYLATGYDPGRNWNPDPAYIAVKIERQPGYYNTLRVPATDLDLLEEG